MSSIKKLNPYLNFEGTADKAIKLYETALGAKVGQVMRFGDAGGSFPVAPENKDRILHASLQIGEGVIMISDCMPGDRTPAGANTHVCVDFGDAADMQKSFDALAVGGTVKMPIGDMFWGAKFGMLTDAYGISWMFNCDHKK